MTERTPADAAQIRQCKLMIEADAIQAMHEKGFAQEHIDAAMQPDPVTPQEAAQLILGQGIEKKLSKSMAHFLHVEGWEQYKNGVQAYTAALRAIAGEAAE